MEYQKIHPSEREYTVRLETIALKPKILYYYGKMPGEEAQEDGAEIADALSSGRRKNQNEWVDNFIQRRVNYKGQSVLRFKVGEQEMEVPEMANPRYPLEGVRRPKTVAIVGARKYTDYGKKYAYEAAYALAKAGLVVVSGLAYGIDSIAHRAALDAGGVTIAVLGTPIDKIYPAVHKNLAREIIEKGGAVISEFGPRPDLIPGEYITEEEALKLGYSLSEIKELQSAGHFKSSFLMRNRIIAGLSDAVIVAEADIHSGSLNTASHALENGIPLFAVPGDLTRQMSRGCNALLSNGAAAYTSPEDVLSVIYNSPLRKVRAKEAPVGENREQSLILNELFKKTTSGDEIMEQTGLSVAEFNATIAMLEISGRVKRMNGGEWSLA